MVLCDRSGKIYFDVQGVDTGAPEIDRSELRQILIDSLPADTIRWNSNLRSVEPGTLHFAHSTETGFDLIVGADGAWSKVRPAVHSFLPFYSSTSMFEVRLRDIDTKHPDLGRMTGQGSFFAFGEDDGKIMLCQRQQDTSLRVYLGAQTGEDWIKDGHVDTSKPDEARAQLAHEYESSGWNKRLVELIKNCDDDIVPRALYMMPHGLRWRTKPGLTLIGDSAHLMTPFAGEGVNTAMWDAMTLADSIIENPTDLDSAVSKYERAMFGRAKQVCDLTWERLLQRFTPGGLNYIADRRRSNMKAAGLVAPNTPKTSIEN